MFLFHCFVHKWPRNVDKVKLKTGSVTPWWFYENCQKGLDICLHFRNAINQHSPNLDGLPSKSNTLVFVSFWIISFVNLKIWNSATTFLTTFSAKFRPVHTLLHVSIYYLILYYTTLKRVEGVEYKMRCTLLHSLFYSITPRFFQSNLWLSSVQFCYLVVIV